MDAPFLCGVELAAPPADTSIMSARSGVPDGKRPGRNGGRNLDAVGLLRRDLARHPLPGRDERHELARRAARGDDAARQAMVLTNMGLVFHFAQRYSGRGVEFSDLVQEGVFGLARAIERFDPDRGVQFSTYASWWIRKSLQQSVTSCGRTIRLPETVEEDRWRLRRARDELASSLGRHPTSAEVEDFTGVGGARRRRVESAARVTMSLDQAMPDGSSTPLDELVAGEQADDFERAEERLVVRAALDELCAEERAVLSLRFGLGDDDPAPVAAVAERLGIDPRRVQRIQAVALRRLGAHPAIQALKGAAA